MRQGQLKQKEFIDPDNAKTWIYALNIPIQAYSVVIILLALLGWAGIISIPWVIFATILLVLTIFSIFGIPFLIGFYFLYLKDISYDRFLNKTRNLHFGITAILIFLQTLLIFVGNFVNLFG